MYLIDDQEPTTVQDTEDSLEGLIDDESIKNFTQDSTEETQEKETNSQKDTEGDSNVVKEDSKPEETDTTNKEATDNKPFLKIKYNKEDKELSQEEAITLAQKGMNYDHLQNKVDEMSKINNRLEEQAKLNGMSVVEYLDSLDKVQEEFEYNKALEETKAKYPEADENLIKELVENKIAASRKDKELSKVNEKTKIAEDNRKSLQQQIDKFLDIHSDIKVDDLEKILTDDMYKLMDQGYTLTEAYDKVKGKEALSNSSKQQEQAKVDQKKEDNKAKSLGNLNNSGDAGKDEMMEAFMSAFK